MKPRSLSLNNFETEVPASLKMAAVARRIGKMASDTTAFFLCDMQEKFRPTIRYFPEIATVANRLVRS